jgi:hypothetical protein
MLSPRCDFQEFLNALKEMDYWEALKAAEAEATAAERLRYQKNILRQTRDRCGGYYAKAVKCFLSLLKYRVVFKPRGLEPGDFSCCMECCRTIKASHRKSAPRDPGLIFRRDQKTMSLT